MAIRSRVILAPQRARHRGQVEDMFWAGEPLGRWAAQATGVMRHNVSSDPAGPDRISAHEHVARTAGRSVDRCVERLMRSSWDVRDDHGTATDSGCRPDTYEPAGRRKATERRFQPLMATMARLSATCSAGSNSRAIAA